MAQLLVREIDGDVVKELKIQAANQGISAEEKHRQILRAALLGDEKKKPSLIEFLLDSEVEPDVELDISRSREIEDHTAGF